MIRSLAALALAAMSTTALHATTATTVATGITGQGTAFDNRGPSLAVTETVTLFGLFPSRDSQIGPVTMSVSDGDYIASIDMFAGNYPPRNSATANGQTLPISQNQALFSLLGTNYGGDGRTNFDLPNLAGRAAVGVNNGQVGVSSGSTTVALTEANLPAHTHQAVVNGQTVTTAAAGGGQAYNSSKPSLGITYLIQTQGIYPTYGGGGGADGMIGQIGAFAGNFVPQGFAIADGQLLSIAQNTALYSIIGNTYGGDGRTTFALPNLTGRAAVGAGVSGSLNEVVTLGEAFGSNSTTLTTAQMPAHTHTLPTGGTTTVAGGSQPIANNGASLGLHYMIDVSGIYPARDAIQAQTFVSNPGEPQLGEISLWAGNMAPSGWAFAEGQLLSIAQNTALYSILGTTYGGDGVTTFALPDFRGRTAIGTGYDSQDGQTYQLGEDVGSAYLTLTTANLPAHDHDYTPPAPPPAPAVPEPASWATMIAGFGLIGATMRRRTRRTVARA